MTKKIFAALIAVIICLSAAISASAYTQEYVIDYADKLSSSELEELNLFAEKLESAYGISVLFCITEGTGDVTADIQSQFILTLHVLSFFIPAVQESSSYVNALNVQRFGSVSGESAQN